MLAEQRVKNYVLNNLNNPTHHHTEKQKANLKKFGGEPTPQEIWEEFFEWSKIKKI